MSTHLPRKKKRTRCAFFEGKEFILRNIENENSDPLGFEPTIHGLQSELSTTEPFHLHRIVSILVQKSSLPLVKVKIFQKQLNVVDIKVHQEEQTYLLLWHQICKNRIKIREFWLWEQSQVRFERLQNQPFCCTNFTLSEDNCVQLNGRFCNLEMCLLFLTYFNLHYIK